MKLQNPKAIKFVSIDNEEVTMAPCILVAIRGSEESLHSKGEEELYSVIHFNS